MVFIIGFVVYLTLTLAPPVNRWVESFLPPCIIHTIEVQLMSCCNLCLCIVHTPHHSCIPFSVWLVAMSNQFPIRAHYPIQPTSQPSVSDSTGAQISNYFASSADNDNPFASIASSRAGTNHPGAPPDTQQPSDSQAADSGVSFQSHVPSDALHMLSMEKSGGNINPGQFFSHDGTQNCSAGFFDSLSSQGQMPNPTLWGHNSNDDVQSLSVQQPQHVGNPVDSVEQPRSNLSNSQSNSSFFAGSSIQNSDFFSSLQQPQSLPVMPSCASTVPPQPGTNASASSTGVIQILNPSVAEPVSSHLYNTQLSVDHLSSDLPSLPSNADSNLSSLPSNAGSNLSSPLPHSPSNADTHFCDPYFGKQTNADPGYSHPTSHSGLQTNADPDYNPSRPKGPLTNLQSDFHPPVVEKDSCKKLSNAGGEFHSSLPLGGDTERHASCAVDAIERPPSAASSLNQSLCSLLDSQEDFTSGASPIRLVAPAPFTHEPLPPVGPSVSLMGEVKLGSELSLLPPAPLPSNRFCDVASGGGKTIQTATDSVAIVQEVSQPESRCEARAMSGYGAPGDLQQNRAVTSHESDGRDLSGTGHSWQDGATSGNPGGFDQEKASRGYGTEQLLAEASADEETVEAGEDVGFTEKGSVSLLVVGEAESLNVSLRASPNCSERSLNDWEIVDNLAEQRVHGVHSAPDLVHPVVGLHQTQQQQPPMPPDAVLGPYGQPTQQQGPPPPDALLGPYGKPIQQQLHGSPDTLLGPYGQPTQQQSPAPPGTLLGPYGQPTQQQSLAPPGTLLGPYGQPTQQQPPAPSDALLGPYGQPTQQQPPEPPNALLGPYGQPQWPQHSCPAPGHFQAPDVVSQSSTVAPDLSHSASPPEFQVHQSPAINPSSVASFAVAPSGLGLPQVVQATLSPEDLSSTGSSDKTLVGISPASDTSQPTVSGSNQTFLPAPIISTPNQSATTSPLLQTATPLSQVITAPSQVVTPPLGSVPQQRNQPENSAAQLHAHQMHELPSVGSANQASLSPPLLPPPPPQNPQHGSLDLGHTTRPNQFVSTGMSLGPAGHTTQPNPQHGSLVLGPAQPNPQHGLLDLGPAGHTTQPNQVISTPQIVHNAVPVVSDATGSGDPLPTLSSQGVVADGPPPPPQPASDTVPSVSPLWSENPLPTPAGCVPTVAYSAVPVVQPPPASGVDLLPQTGLPKAPEVSQISSVAATGHNQPTVQPPTGLPTHPPTSGAPQIPSVANVAQNLPHQIGLSSAPSTVAPPPASGAPQVPNVVASSQPTVQSLPTAPSSVAPPPISVAPQIPNVATITHNQQQAVQSDIMLPVSTSEQAPPSLHAPELKSIVEPELLMGKQLEPSVSTTITSTEPPPSTDSRAQHHDASIEDEGRKIDSNQTYGIPADSARTDSDQTYTVSSDPHQQHYDEYEGRGEPPRDGHRPPYSGDYEERTDPHGEGYRPPYSGDRDPYYRDYAYDDRYRPSYPDPADPYHRPPYGYPPDPYAPPHPDHRDRHPSSYHPPHGRPGYDPYARYPPYGADPYRHPRDPYYDPYGYGGGYDPRRVPPFHRYPPTHPPPPPHEYPPSQYYPPYDRDPAYDHGDHHFPQTPHGGGGYSYPEGTYSQDPEGGYSSHQQTGEQALPTDPEPSVIYPGTTDQNFEDSQVFESPNTRMPAHPQTVPLNSTYLDPSQPPATITTQMGVAHPYQAQEVGGVYHQEGGGAYDQPQAVQGGEYYQGEYTEGVDYTGYQGDPSYYYDNTIADDSQEQWEGEEENVEPPQPARGTPEIFSCPHARVTFSFGGQLVVVLPSNVCAGQPAVVEIQGVRDLLMDDESREFVEAVKDSPGPFMPRDTPKNVVVSFSSARAQECRERRGALAGSDGSAVLSDAEQCEDEVLFWEFLMLLCQQNGVVMPTDVADLLMRERTTTFKSSTHLGSQGQPECLDELRKLLLSGRKKDALDYACSKSIWGHALMLASRMDEQSRTYVVNRFTASLMTTDPLNTFYTLLLGRTPSLVKPDGLSRAGDWRPHLSMILANKITKLDTSSIVSLGDSLKAKGRLHAAHLCFYLGDVSFGCYGDAEARYSLLGIDHATLTAGTYPRPRDLRKMEVFEYAMCLTKQDFALPAFQVFKLLLVFKLVEYSFLKMALKYCEQISCTVSKRMHSYVPTFLTSLVSISIRLHHFTSDFDYSETELPSWLHQLQQSAGDILSTDFTPNLLSPSPAFSSVSQTYSSHSGQPPQMIIGLQKDTPYLAVPQLAAFSRLKEGVAVVPSRKEGDEDLQRVGGHTVAPSNQGLEYYNTQSGEGLGVKEEAGGEVLSEGAVQQSTLQQEPGMALEGNQQQFQYGAQVENQQQIQYGARMEGEGQVPMLGTQEPGMALQENQQQFQYGAQVEGEGQVPMLETQEPGMALQENQQQLQYGAQMEGEGQVPMLGSNSAQELSVQQQQQQGSGYGYPTSSSNEAVQAADQGVSDGGSGGNMMMGGVQPGQGYYGEQLDSGTLCTYIHFICRMCVCVYMYVWC